MDRKVLFNHLRAGILGSLDAHEVKGTEAILDAMAGQPLAFTAYALATAFHETGGKMFPSTESLNYSVQGLLNGFGRHRISAADARRLGRTSTRAADQQAIGNAIYGGKWGRDNLGNTVANDGWHFRGHGMDHVTGRDNFRKVADELGLGDALMVNPSMLLDPALAAKCIASGMLRGRYRRFKLATFLPTSGPAKREAFADARAIINADVEKNGLLVARYAQQFQSALQSAGW